jgi:hypothetical protein
MVNREDGWDWPGPGGPLRLDWSGQHQAAQYSCPDCSSTDFIFHDVIFHEFSSPAFI